MSPPPKTPYMVCLKIPHGISLQTPGGITTYPEVYEDKPRGIFQADPVFVYRDHRLIKTN